MKKLLTISLLSVLLTGCAGQTATDRAQNNAISSNTLRISALEKTDGAYLLKFNKLDTALPALRTRVNSSDTSITAMRTRVAAAAAATTTATNLATTATATATNAAATVAAMSQRLALAEQRHVKDSTTIALMQVQLNDLQDISVKTVIAAARLENRVDSLQGTIDFRSIKVDLAQFTVDGNRVLSLTQLNDIMQRLAKLEAKLP